MRALILCRGFVTLLFSVSLTSCAGDSRKNFEDIIGSRVGQGLAALPWNPISSRAVGDDMQELKYSCCSKTCFYYYVWDEKAKVITSWRYEGDCYIRP
jgi:hypothetical protein